MPDTKRYETFVSDWHYFLRDLQESLEEAGEVRRKTSCMYVLQNFYARSFEEGDFYLQFYERLKQAEEVLGLKK